MDAYNFTIKNGATVVIEHDEVSMTVVVKTSTGQRIGEITYDVKDCPSGDYVYLLKAHLEGVPGYKRQGIGRECVREIREVNGLPVYVAENDGMTRDDGSHLTEEAPAFVQRLRQEGLIERNSTEM